MLKILSGAVDSDIHLFVMGGKKKSFDIFYRGILDRVLSSLGLPAWFRHVCFEYHALVRLRFKLAAGLGESFCHVEEDAWQQANSEATACRSSTWSSGPRVRMRRVKPQTGGERDLESGRWRSGGQSSRIDSRPMSRPKSSRELHNGWIAWMKRQRVLDDDRASMVEQ